MKVNLMPEVRTRYPLAEFAVPKIDGPYGAIDPQRALLIEEVVENIRRVKRQRLHSEAQERKLARKLRNKEKKG